MANIKPSGDSVYYVLLPEVPLACNTFHLKNRSPTLWEKDLSIQDGKLGIVVLPLFI